MLALQKRIDKYNQEMRDLVYIYEVKEIMEYIKQSLACSDFEYELVELRKVLERATRMKSQIKGVIEGYELATGVKIKLQQKLLVEHSLPQVSMVDTSLFTKLGYYEYPADEKPLFDDDVFATIHIIN